MMNGEIPRSVVERIVRREIARREGGNVAALALELSSAGRGDYASWERRLRIWLGEPVTSRSTGVTYVQRSVTVDSLDKFLSSLDLNHLWYEPGLLDGPFNPDPLVEIAQAKHEVVVKRVNTKRRKDARLSDDQLRELHRRHSDENVSKRALVRELVADGVYSTETAADDAIRAGWKWLGLKARPRVAATVLASTKHGELIGAKKHEGVGRTLRNRYKRRLNARRRATDPAFRAAERERIADLRARHDRSRGKEAA